MVVPLSPLGEGTWTAWVAAGAAAEAPRPATATIPNIEMKRADSNATPIPNFLRNSILFISQRDPFHVGRTSASVLPRCLFVTGPLTYVISKNLINISLSPITTLRTRCELRTAPAMPANTLFRDSLHARAATPVLPKGRRCALNRRYQRSGCMSVGQKPTGWYSGQPAGDTN